MGIQWVRWIWRWFGMGLLGEWDFEDMEFETLILISC